MFYGVHFYYLEEHLLLSMKRNIYVYGIDAHGDDDHSYGAEGLKPSRHRKMTRKYAKKLIANKEKNTDNVTHRYILAKAAPE